MKKNIPHRIMQLQRLLLQKQEEIVLGLRNHRIVDALAGTESFDAVAQRDIDLLRFAADSDVLIEIRSALDRISEGTFGVCEECGERIPAKRLEALPWARYCVSCQDNLENKAREFCDQLQWTSPHRSQPRAAA